MNTQHVISAVGGLSVQTKPPAVDENLSDSCWDVHRRVNVLKSNSRPVKCIVTLTKMTDFSWFEHWKHYGYTSK